MRSEKQGVLKEKKKSKRPNARKIYLAKNTPESTNFTYL